MTESTGELPKNSEVRDEALRAAYAKAKQEFLQLDWRRYEDEEEGIPLAQVIEELEEIHRRADEK